jgi:hypothetical protein
MYGKGRIALTREGKIVKAGNKSWHPIGTWHKDGLTYVAKVLTPGHKWERQLTANNAELLFCQSKNEIRERVADLYS